MIYKIKTDSVGFMLDIQDVSTGIMLPSGWVFEEYKEKHNLVQLIDAGMSADDLTKLKANGVI